MKHLNKRIILLGFSCVLLIGVTVYLTTAWYTRMVYSDGMEFEIAQWEFTANQMIDDFSVNIYQYSNVAHDDNGNTLVVAPGTAGYIPISLSLGDSEVDIEYYVTVDVSTMSDEFQDRIFFYYIDEDDETETLIPFENLGDDLSGVITMDEETEQIYVYWEWVYEVEPSYDDIVAYMTADESTDESTSEDTAVDTTSTAYLLARQALIDEANEFDTLVGKNPDDYESDIIATLQIYGVQETPTSTGEDDNAFETE